MFLIPTWERGHLGCSVYKKLGLKLSKADTFDMIQQAFEENNMDKATVYTWAKKGKSVMKSVGRKRKCVSRKKP